jgi:hypothetical protein
MPYAVSNATLAILEIYDRQRKVFTTPPQLKRAMPELREIVPSPARVTNQGRCAEAGRTGTHMERKIAKEKACDQGGKA